MKPLNFFKKKFVNGGVRRATIGITDAEYNKIHDGVRAAYEAACARQKSCDAKPSGYMKGLKEALSIVNSIQPHIMEVQ